MTAAWLPLSALLSQVLVALTIEIDNTYETRAPHNTTQLGGSGPWLTSYGMWANFLRLVPPEGILARALAARAGWNKSPHPSQAGMERWGYVAVAPSADEARAKLPKSQWVVTPTGAGRLCASIWAPLADEIEGRWVARFGEALVAEVRDRATVVVGRLDLTLPAYLPQLGWPLLTEAPSSDQTVAGDPGLVTAVANALHAFAIEYEQDSRVGLAAGANVLRVIDDTGVRVRDVPGRAGISTAAASWATGVLEKRGFVAVEPDPDAKRGKVVRLTRQGAQQRAAYEPRAEAVEAGWDVRFGDAAADLRSALEEVVGLDDGAVLRSGMAAPEGCWRAVVKQSVVIPHFPMVLHRGNYPDGS